MSDLHACLEYATQTHRGQFRKCGVLPYIVHPVEVMKTLFNWGIHEQGVLMVALLHDVLEDCRDRTDEDTIRTLFGDQVASLVAELTHDPARESKDHYLKSFPQKSTEALLVKAADRLCNARDFSLVDVPYAQKYLKKAAGIFDELERRGVCPHAVEAARNDLARYARSQSKQD